MFNQLMWWLEPSVQVKKRKSLVLPWAAYPSEGRRRLKEGSAVPEVLSDHTGPSGWSWRELESTHCRMQW